MKAKIAIIAMLPIYMFGLNLDETIRLALQNSDVIKEQAFNTKQSRADLLAQYGRFSPKVGLQYTITQNTRVNDSVYTINLSNLQVTYNLFNGLIDFYGLKSYTNLHKAQQYMYEASKQDIILLAKSLYIKILQARDNLAISTESIRLLELQKAQAEQFYLQGVKAKSDLLSVEVMLANAKVTQSNDKNLLHHATLALQKLIMQEVDVQTLEEIRLQSLETLSFDRERLLSIMLSHRSEYLYMQEMIASIENQKNALYGNFLPALDVSFSKRWYSNDVSVLNRFGTNLQSQALLGMSWNFFNGLSDMYAIESKRYEVLATKSKLSDLKREMMLSLDKALDDLVIAKEQYSISQKAIVLAEENYRIIQNRYQQNIETSRELLNVEVALNQARLHFNQSQHRINLALANLERIVQNPLLFLD
ncbi:TolC family protein [Helicobacter equorum]|uniref:TolC family protein n=1 Tax=Helicobacter equorum TaxID=361872 RepID=UPI000CF1431C|nr:TolC family protein [Helicobacter equorum]